MNAFPFHSLLFLLIPYLGNSLSALYGVNPNSNKNKLKNKSKQNQKGILFQQQRFQYHNFCKPIFPLFWFKFPAINFFMLDMVASYGLTWACKLRITLFYTCQAVNKLYSRKPSNFIIINNLTKFEHCQNCLNCMVYHKLTKTVRYKKVTGQIVYINFFIKERLSMNCSRSIW